MYSKDELINAAKKILREIEEGKAESNLHLLSRKTAKKILRKTPIQNSFHFHKDKNKPLWISSNNLEDFYNKIKTIDLRAVEYHLSRRDFEEWIRYLGDTLLVEKISQIRTNKMSGESLRRLLCEIIQNRLIELRRVSG